MRLRRERCQPLARRARAGRRRLYRLALESAPAGSPLHEVGHNGIRFREIAATTGARLGEEGRV
ncbi:MAG: hypothetical protein ACRDNK_09865, partial [Solirubrobacteraceae bacterium]